MNNGSGVMVSSACQSFVHVQIKNFAYHLLSTKSFLSETGDAAGYVGSA